MIASRAQILQEAWNGLWSAQEPYLVPAIPLIGFEMSGVNGGRAMLLGKMHNQINILQDLGNQLCHYIDVNHSLVEELRMEGIERLAANKLLLVEVEREVIRRITHICSNKSVRDLSSMHQFLFQLRPPISTTFPSTADESMDHVESTTNGSCSTQKVTTEGSSEAHQRSLETVSKDIDAVSPDSQSFASKCLATQGENMHPPSSIRCIGLISTNVLDCGQFPSDLIAKRTNVSSCASALASALDIKLDVRNHSSSSSEERLPKVVRAGNGHDEVPQGVGNITEKQEHGNETGAEKQIEESSIRKSPVSAGIQPVASANRLLLSEPGRAISCTGRGASLVEVELTQEAALEVDFMVHNDSNIPASSLPDFKAAELVAGQDLGKPLEMGLMSKISSHDFKSTQLGLSRKHQAECASSLGGNLGETIDLVARKSKRAKVQTLFEVTKAGLSTSKDSLTQLMHLRQGSCSDGLNDKAAEGERIDTTTCRQLDSSFMPCSCDQQKSGPLNTHSPALDLKPVVQCRCKECGGILSHSLTQQANQHSLEQAPMDAGHVFESPPIPATQ